MEWEDAWTSALAQFNTPEEAMSSYVPMMRKTVGFWVGRNEHVTMVATDDDRAPNCPGALAGIAYIPAAMVRGIEIVRGPVSKK